VVLFTGPVTRGALPKAVKTLKARISLCKVEPPGIQTYRHFLTHIAICSGIGEIPISEVPAEFTKVLSKGSGVIIPCTLQNSAKALQSIVKM